MRFALVLAVAILALPLRGFSQCTYLLEGSAFEVVLLERIDGDGIGGEELFEAAVAGAVHGIEGAIAIPNPATLTIAAQPFAWHQLRLSVRELRTPVGIYQLSAFIAAVEAKRVRVSQGLVRQTARLFFVSRSTAVRLPSGTKLVVKMATNTKLCEVAK